MARKGAHLIVPQTCWGVTLSRSIQVWVTPHYGHELMVRLVVGPFSLCWHKALLEPLLEPLQYTSDLGRPAAIIKVVLTLPSNA